LNIQHGISEISEVLLNIQHIQHIQHGDHVEYSTWGGEIMQHVQRCSTCMLKTQVHNATRDRAIFNICNIIYAPPCYFGGGLYKNVLNC